ncbi:MAG: FAD-dependent oxidoreductase [Casimicrobiaceae bacterium]
MPDSQYDVIVVGAGIAGLTAAKELASAGLATACIEAQMFGGLVVNINELEPAPPGGVASGVELASNLMEQATELGMDSPTAMVTGIERNGDAFTLATDTDEYRARAIVIASGAKLRRLGVPGEVEFEHRGVAQCADCDGPLYKGQDVVVVGGGDSALQEALVLAHYCRRVHLVHRGERFRARPDLVAAVRERDNIAPRFRTVVEAILGNDMVGKVRVRDLAEGSTSEIPCTGFFAYVGMAPNTAFVPSEVNRDAQDRLVTDEALQTTMPGVFAAGAVRAGCGGLITDAIADAQRAASSVRAWLATA